MEDGISSRSDSYPVDSSLGRVDLLAARAMDGDRDSLTELVADPALLAAPRFKRAIPAIALAASESGLEVPAPWRNDLIGAAVAGMLLKQQLDAVGSVLDAAGIPWMPIKGMDLGYRLWPGPEARPTSDLDVLVPAARFAEARASLGEAGWKGLGEGDEYESYLQSEGYNWQAGNQSGTLLELHFRLWPSAPGAWVDEVWERSLEAPALGPMARCPAWSDAFLLCAVHIWQLPPPHALLYFRELELIARKGGEIVLDEAASAARRWGLSLQVCLAALYAADLWTNPAMRNLGVALQSDLHLPERLLLRHALARGIDAASLGQLYVARLFSGRETRHGWKVAFRRLWPHPALSARLRRPARAA